jgi:hypothetical protein
LLLTTFPFLVEQWYEASADQEANQGTDALTSLICLTATGIAPDLHRTSLLIPTFQDECAGTKIGTNLVTKSMKGKFVYTSLVEKHFY